MHLYREGDRSAGICEACRRKVGTVMTYIDFRPAGADVTVPDVLIGVCEACGAPVGVPHQSTPRINEELRRAAEAEVPATVNARVPRVLDEALGLATATIGGRSGEFRPAMLRYYLGLVGEDPGVAGEVEARSRSSLALGKADGRLVLKISRRRWEAAKSGAKAAGIARDSDLLRGIAALVAEDFRIALDGEPGPARATRASKARVSFLKGLAGSL